MRAIGLILAGGNNFRMKELTKNRAIAAMPIAGSYKSIDFALSNMTNSHITRVGVLTQYNARSLNEHLSSSKWWNFGRKMGGLYVFNPTVTQDNGFWYRGTADSIYQNIGFLKESHEPYVIIASGDAIYKLDYGKVLEYHIDKKSDITIVCKDIDNCSDKGRYGFVRLNDDNRIEEFDEKPQIVKQGTISCGIYVIRRRLLIELIEKSAEEDRFDFVRDIIMNNVDDKKIYAYKMSEYWTNISSIDDYYKANMDFLNPEIRNYFYKTYPAIYSKVEDLPPAKYNYGSKVSNSLISSGAIINGTVENSVLFKKVFVGNNCVIRNSIILDDVYIGDNSVIENCIIDGRGTVRANTTYKGEDGIKVIIEQSDRYVF